MWNETNTKVKLSKSLHFLGVTIAFFGIVNHSINSYFEKNYIIDKEVIIEVNNE